MTWAKGSQLKTSVKTSASSALYFALTSPSKPYIWFMLIVSWLPRDICKKVVG